MALKEWTQRKWTTPRVDLYRDKGDFGSMNGLILSNDTHQIERAPAWSAFKQVKSTTITPTSLQASFTTDNHALAQIVFIGHLSTTLYSFVIVDQFTTSHILTTASVALDGKDGQNVLYNGGLLYLILSPGNVYRGTGYQGAVSAWGGLPANTAELLVSWNNRIFVATNTGEILQVNDDDTAFETFYTPQESIDIIFATPYKGYLMLAVQHTDNTHSIYRLYYSGRITEITTLPQSPADTNTFSNIFAHLQGDLYFIFNSDSLDIAGNTIISLYKFNGTKVELITKLNLGTFTDTLVLNDINLFAWRDRLVLAIIKAHDTDPVTHEFKVLNGLKGDDFTNLGDIETYSHVRGHANSIGGQLLMTARNEASTQYGYHILGQGEIPITGTQALQDGSFETSILDFNHPASPKQLEKLTVHMSDSITDFKINIKYKVDDETSWTTAASGLDNTRRIEATNLKIPFYTIQVRIEIDDNTGANKDFRINAVSVTYNIFTETEDVK